MTAEAAGRVAGVLLLVAAGCFSDSGQGSTSQSTESSTGSGSAETSGASTTSGRTSSATDASATMTSSGSTSSSTGEGMDPSLLLWFDFEEDPTIATGAFDKSGNMLHGTCTACPTQTPGPPGQGSAALFDGATQFISAGEAAVLEPTDELTFAAWARLDAASGTFAVVLAREAGPVNFNAWDLYYDAGQAGYRVSTQSQFSAASMGIGVGDWAHVAGTWSSAEEALRIYVNGLALGPTLAPDPPLYPDTRLTIGADLSGGVQIPFPGAIDDVRIYSRALSADEIAALAQ